MSTILVNSEAPVTLIGAGACADDDVRAALARAPTVVAADGGASTALRHDVMPQAVVGDFDSIGADVLARLPAGRVFRIEEQESTDFDKGLRSIEAPLVLGVGFLGGRIDHALASMAVLARTGRRCILIGPDDVVFAAPSRLRLDIAAGARVSLFPMGPVEGRSEGLRWPIEGISFEPAGRIGTSNVATGPVTLDLPRRGMLVILPRTELDAAITALSA